MSAISDSWAITGRDLLHWRAQPGLLLVGWLFPVLVVLMFTGLFGGALQTPAGGGYAEYLMPGMFALAMLFGVEVTMMAVTVDAEKGVTDRFRSLPLSDGAVLLGRCTADFLNSIVGLAVLVGTGLLLGWRANLGPGRAAVAIGLLLLLRFALLWVGCYLGLLAGSPQAVVAVQIAVWPVGFLSSVFVDPSTMPGWLGAIADWNPLSATAGAIRELFGNPVVGGGTWAADHATLLAVAWPLVLTAVFGPLAVRRYRRLGE